MGMVLMQGGRSICYHSEVFNGVVLNYPTYDNELHALVQVVNKWKHYLMVIRNGFGLMNGCKT
jgi:hypothetical protein